jgi:hypothetical protein
MSAVLQCQPREMLSVTRDKHATGQSQSRRCRGQEDMQQAGRAAGTGQGCALPKVQTASCSAIYLFASLRGLVVKTWRLVRARHALVYPLLRLAVRPAPRYAPSRVADVPWDDWIRQEHRETRRLPNRCAPLTLRTPVSLRATPATLLLARAARMI